MLTGVLASGKSGSALTKTTTVLLRIWSRVPRPAVGLRNRIAPVIPGAQCARAARRSLVHVPRNLSFLFGRCSYHRKASCAARRSFIVRLERRLAERWGDRSLMPQASGKVVRSMVAWGVLRNIKPGLYGSFDRPLHISAGRTFPCGGHVDWQCSEIPADNQHRQASSTLSISDGRIRKRSPRRKTILGSSPGGGHGDR